MATYIVLLDYTDQGIRNIQDSPQRADAFNDLAKRAGVRILGQYWTLGSHDGVLILEAPSEEAAASVLLHLGNTGNVRTTTLRAFNWAEAQDLIAKNSSPIAQPFWPSKPSGNQPSRIDAFRPPCSGGFMPLVPLASFGRTGLLCNGDPIRFDAVEESLEGTELELGPRTRWWKPGTSRRLDLELRGVNRTDQPDGVEDTWELLTLGTLFTVLGS